MDSDSDSPFNYSWPSFPKMRMQRKTGKKGNASSNSYLLLFFFFFLKLFRCPLSLVAGTSPLKLDKAGCSVPL